MPVVIDREASGCDLGVSLASCKVRYDPQTLSNENDPVSTTAYNTTATRFARVNSAPTEATAVSQTFSHIVIDENDTVIFCQTLTALT